MTERLRSANCANSAKTAEKMANDLSPKKTLLVLVIVVGCFAVLWPKVFYPMLVGSAQQHIKPSPIDRTTGCCDVISETDVNTIKIMSEICSTIIKRDEDMPLTGKEMIAKCRSVVLDTCGIDISAVLQEQVRLGQSVKHIVDEVRSLNGSLCLKYNFGVAPWRLGVPHRIHNVQTTPSSLRQERPLQLRSELVHPAFRERGRAIPVPQAVSSPSRPPPRIVEGRPGPLPGMRPTMGGAGHVVPPPKQGTSSMGLIMPIYTIGIVIFFTYTVMKIIFKKQPETLYSQVESDPNFRREVFEAERAQHGQKPLAKDNNSTSTSSKLVVNAMSALLDEVDQEIESRHKASEVAQQDDDQATVKVLGMEMTASCEGGKKWSRPDSPMLPPLPQEPVEPPQEIYLEGTLPAQSHLLVADSATEAQETNTEEEDPAVVLAGKMTLSVISLDSSENGTDESFNSGKKQEEGRSSSNTSDDFEKIEVDNLEDQLNDIIREAENVSQQMVPEKKEDIKSDILESIQREIENVEETIQLKSKNKVVDAFEAEEAKDIEEVENKTKELESENVENTKSLQSDLMMHVEKPQSEEVKDEEEENKSLGSSETFENLEVEENDEVQEEINKTTEAQEMIEKIVEAQEIIEVQEKVEETTDAQRKLIETTDVEDKVEEPEKVKEVVEETSGLQGKVKEATEVGKKEINAEINLKIDEPQSERQDTILVESSDLLTKGTNFEDIEKSQLHNELKPKEEDSRSLKGSETFKKLNEAIADLSSELRQKTPELILNEPLDTKEEEEEEEKEDEACEDEEIEYEYEDSENEDEVDEEISILGEDRVNGNNDYRRFQEDITGSDTIAQNDIDVEEQEMSNEDDQEDDDDDEEVEEIIEYISDDEEEEEIEEVADECRNNVNHLDEEHE